MNRTSLKRNEDLYRDCSKAYMQANCTSQQARNMGLDTARKLCLFRHHKNELLHSSTRRRRRSNQHFDGPSDNYRSWCVIENHRLIAQPATATPNFDVLQMRLASATFSHCPAVEVSRAGASPATQMRPHRTPFAGPSPSHSVHWTTSHQRRQGRRTRRGTWETAKRNSDCPVFYKAMILALGALSHVLAASAASIPGLTIDANTIPSTAAPSAETTRPSANYEILQPPKYLVANRINELRVERSILTPPVRFRRTSPQNTPAPFLDQYDKPQRLVTRRGLFVEIKKNGKVKATRKSNGAFSVVQFRSGGAGGVVYIYGKKSKRYLSMDSKGKLVGQKVPSSSCKFNERIVENHYYVFYQRRLSKKGRRRTMKTMFVAFDNKGRPKRGKKIQSNNSMTHFNKRAAKIKKPRLRNRRRKLPKSRKLPKQT